MLAALRKQAVLILCLAVSLQRVVGLVVVTQLLLCPEVLVVVDTDSYQQQRAAQLHHLVKVMPVVMDGLILGNQVAVVAVLVLLVVALLLTQTWAVRVLPHLSLVHL